MPRTTILFPYVGGDVIGGSHHSSLKLAAALDPLRFRPLVRLHGRSGTLGEFVRSLGLDHEVLHDAPVLAPRYSREPDTATVARYLGRTVPRLVRLIRETGASIIHTNDGRMHITWALPARLAGARLLWHHRGDPRAFGVNKVAPLLAHRILSVSHFAAPKRPVWPIANRFEVARSPFEFPAEPPDRGAARAALLAEIGAPSSAVLLGYVGGLNVRKRPLHFVRAVEAVIRALPDRPVFGLLFGEIEIAGCHLDREVEALAGELGVGARIRLMGYRSPILPPMSALDALVVTALNEPFGRTLVEAMDLRVPVVATRHGGNVEAIEERRTGFLVDEVDPEAFVAPIVALVRSAELRHRITTAAHRDVRNRFGLARSVAQISRIYDELVGKDVARQALDVTSVG